MIWYVLALFLSVSSVPVPFDSNFTLDVDFQQPTVDLTFEYKNTGWCGIGLGSGLTRVDVILVSITENYVVTLEDAFSFGNFGPEDDTELGGRNDLRLVDWNITEGTVYVRVSRAMVTGDRFDTDFVRGPMNISYAYSAAQVFDYSLATTGEVAVDFSSTTTAAVIPGAMNWKGHGKWFLWLWTVPVPIALVVTRAFRFTPLWIVIHVATGITVVSINTGLVLHAFHRSRNDLNSKFHNRDGLTLAALAILQLVLGLATLLYSRTKKYISRIRIARKIHTFLGVTIFVLALRNIWGGRRIVYDSSKLSIALICIFTAVLIIEEAFSHSRLVTDVFLKIWSKKYTHADVFRLINEDGKSICFMDQYVINVFTLQLYHPGGVKPITASIGEDLGKYINGVVGFNRLMGYHHSLYARQLSKRLCIGTVKYPEGIIEGVRENPNYETNTWRLAKKIEIAEGTWQLFLTSRDYKVAHRCPGVEWMGRHIMIKQRFGLELIRRYYSMSLCMTHARVSEWRTFAHDCGVAIVEPKEELYAIDEGEDTAGAIVLHVRIYREGIMSNWLISLQPTEPVRVKAPLGVGLLLDPALRGTGLIIAGGSGVVPFLDLVDYLWWKEMKEQGYPVTFETNALDGFSLVFCAFFHNRNRVLGVHLMQSTHDLCQGQPNPRFVFELKFDAEFDANSKVNFLRKLIQGQNLSRIWVCGPSGLDRTVEQIADEEGINKKIITVL